MTKLHTKSYSNNDRMFFMLNPNEDIAENDPVRVVDAMVENLDLRDFKNCTANADADAVHTIRRCCSRLFSTPI